MEFDDVIVKNPGLCRCCFSEGCYKELGTEYIWMDENEVYADMLLDCFDISISQHNEGPNGTNRLICEVCITRLRDACNFKKQVLESEKKFVDMVGRGDFNQKVTVDILDEENLKLEQNLDDQSQDAINYDFLEEPMDFDNESVVVDDVTAEPLPVKEKRGRPKKSPKPVKKMSEEKPRTSKTKVSDQLEDEEEKIKAIRSNISQVLLNSNVMPFRWLKTCFRCFYCYEMFDSPIQLKTHQDKHTTQDFLKTISNYYETTVLVDITNVNCQLCDEVVDSLHDVIHHLTEKHAMVFEDIIGTCLIPFKLDSCQCVLCNTKLSSHGSVVAHMKKHKNFINSNCDICQVNFSNSKYIQNDVICCMDCNEGFNEGMLPEHMKYVHNKRFRCSACWEFFTTHYQRSLHMARIHKRRGFIKCLYCSQSFIFEGLLRRHIKRRHLKEKNFICDICGYETYWHFELKAHLVKHSNTRDYNCTMCGKMFKTKKIMRRHSLKCH